MYPPTGPRESAPAAATVLINTVPPGAPSHARASRPDDTPAPPAPPAIFPRVPGYEILSVVGTGGMGIVYEARHQALGRRVALKTLRGEALSDPAHRDRFRAEAAVMARLQHPNIIQVFEVGAVEARAGESGTPFIALEFVDGGSLSSRTRGPQPPREAALTVETLARAAHAAHRVGVIHRDLKPSNVLLTRDGQPKIADFGIAKQLGTEAPRADTLAGVVMGTPEYMAPEQLEGGPASPAFDIYALGAILYELLTGRVPFQGAAFAETMMLIRLQEPVPPRRLQPGTPRDLETICLKCLEKSPAKRYATAEALAEDLARWAEGKAIRARPVGCVERTQRWARRNPAVAALSAAVLLVAVTGLAGIAWGWNESQANALVAQANARRAEEEAVNARKSARKERWEHYRASVFAASSALRLHDTNAGRRAIDDAPPEHRDWAWRLLRARLDRSRGVLRGHPGLNESAWFTPDARWALLRGEGGQFRVWNLATRTQATLGLDSEARAPALSPEGATLAFADAGHAVHLRDTATGRDRLTLRGHSGEVHTITFAEGSRVVTAAHDRTIRVWDARAGRELRRFEPPAEAAGPVVISPDGRRVAIRGTPGYSTRVWELDAGREVVLDDRDQDALLCRFSPRGDKLVTVRAFPDTTIRLWEASTGRLLATMRGHANQVTHILFSPDGSRLATASMDRSVRVWDAAAEPAGRESQARVVLRGHTGWVDHAAFSPDGSRVISSSQDRTVRYWDADTGEQLAVLCGHTAAVRLAAFRADAPELVSASVDGTLRFWDVPDLERGYALRGHKKFAYSVAFFPDGERVASAGWDGTARVWNPTTGRELKSLDHGDDLYVASVAVHPAGKFLATLARHRNRSSAAVRLWDASTGEVLHRWAVPAGWQDGRLAFDPAGEHLAAGCADFRVRLWDVRTKAEVATLEGHSAPVRDVAFSPDGRWLASAGDDGDGTVRLWDANSRRLVRVLEGHSRGVYSLAWNRAGTVLAAGSLDGTVSLWDTATWQRTGDNLKVGAAAYGVAFTADGTLLAVACEDNLVRLWDVGMRQELAELSGHRDYVHHLAFSPDGTRLVSASGDWTLRMWDTLTPAERAGRRP